MQRRKDRAADKERRKRDQEAKANAAYYASKEFRAYTLLKEGIALEKAMGQTEAVLEKYRQAFELDPSSRWNRWYYYSMLIDRAGNALDLAERDHDLAQLVLAERYLQDARRIDSAKLDKVSQSHGDYRRTLDIWLGEAGAIRKRWKGEARALGARQAAEAEANRKAAAAARKAKQQQDTIQLNKGALTAEGAAAASGPARRKPPVSADTALGQAEAIVAGKASVGEMLEGGQTPTDPNRFMPVKPAGEIGSGGFTPQQQARLDRDPAYSKAKAREIVAQERLERARSNDAAYRQIAELAAKGMAKAPDPAERARIDRDLAQSAAEAAAAKKEVDSQVKRVMAEPIYEGE